MNIPLQKRDLTRLAGFAVVALGAAIPLSVAFTSALVAVVALLGAISGIYARHWRDVSSNPVVLPALMLFAWLSLTLVYTEAPLDEAFRVLKKYRELLIIAVLLPFFLSPETRLWGTRAFVAALMVALAGSYADAVGQYMESGALVEDPVIVKNRITQSTLLSFAAFWIVLQLGPDRRRRLWLIPLVLIVFNVFFMLGGRTGMVIFMALAALLLFNRFRWRGLAYATAGSAALLLLAFAASDHFAGRVQESLSVVSDYRSGDFASPSALRLSYLANTAELLRERPVFGYGLGSFTAAYAGHVAGTPMPPTVNPHNEFLLIGMHGGVIGIVLYCFLLLQQLRYSSRLPQHDRLLAQALVVTMGVGCLLNSFLLDSTEGHFFAYFTALLFARLASGPDMSPAWLDIRAPEEPPPGPLSKP